MTCSGVPVKRFLSSGSCVAIPTGQVFRWQERGDYHVAARLELAVGLQDHAPPQIVLDQHLLSFGEPELPR
jgi:hypothetical protein